MAGSGRGEPQCRVSAAALLFAALVAILSSASTPARAADTRRAFLVGIERYSDGFIQRLDRTVNDAKDLAKDLEEVGFDKKNIKVVADLKSRDAFEKEFSERGIKDVVAKPFDLNDLLDRVRVLCPPDAGGSS